MSDKLEVVFSEFEHRVTKEKMRTLDLSKTILRYFAKKDIQINLDKTIDNELPTDYAFIKTRSGRGFTASKESEIYSTEKNDFFVIYLRLNKLTIGRVKVFDLNTLVNIVFKWIGKGTRIEILQKEYVGIEIFIPIDDLSNVNLKTWNNIKNFIFSKFIFYAYNSKWEKPYFEMLEKIAKDKRFSKFIPFTSHYRLHLNNKDKELPWYFITVSKDDGYVIAEQTLDQDKNNKSYKSLDLAIDYYFKVLSELENKK